MELYVGLQFTNSNMPGAVHSIKLVNTATNTLAVETNPGPGRQSFVETNWNLEHTIWGFKRGEYRVIEEPEHTPRVSDDSPEPTQY